MRVKSRKLFITVILSAFLGFIYGSNPGYTEGISTVEDNQLSIIEDKVSDLINGNILIGIEECYINVQYEELEIEENISNSDGLLSCNVELETGLGGELESTSATGAYVVIYAYTKESQESQTEILVKDTTTGKTISDGYIYECDDLWYGQDAMVLCYNCGLDSNRQLEVGLHTQSSEDCVGGGVAKAKIIVTIISSHPDYPSNDYPKFVNWSCTE